MSILVKDANGATVEVDTIDDLIVITGQKTDAARTATDDTPVTAMSIFKQISKSIQALTAIISGGKLAVSDASLLAGVNSAQGIATVDVSSADVTLSKTCRALMVAV